MSSGRTAGKLHGKVAIVTGAGQGIGRAIALEFATNGASVVVASRTASRVAEVADEIRAVGGSALGAPCNVGHREEIEAMVSTTVDQFGGVDILVNNAQGFGTEAEPAGSPVKHALESLPEDQWDWNFETGVKATLRTMRAVFPSMKQRGGGRIINFGSATATMGTPGNADYVANKEAIRALSRVAAREWGAIGITVNVICPAIMTNAVVDSRERNAAWPSDPKLTNSLGRIGEVDDAGKLALFLAGPDGGYITGQTLNLDGGIVVLP